MAIKWNSTKFTQVDWSNEDVCLYKGCKKWKVCNISQRKIEPIVSCIFCQPACNATCVVQSSRKKLKKFLQNANAHFPRDVFNGSIQIFVSDQARQIQPLGCVSKTSGERGVCMFAWNCVEARGKHLGTCIDRFYFGSCCQLPGAVMNKLFPLF